MDHDKNRDDLDREARERARLERERQLREAADPQLRPEDEPFNDPLRDADLAVEAETRAAAVNAGGANAAMNNQSGASTASFVPPTGDAPDVAPAIPGEGQIRDDLHRESQIRDDVNSQPYTDWSGQDSRNPNVQEYRQTPPPPQNQAYGQPVNQPYGQPGAQSQPYQQTGEQPLMNEPPQAVPPHQQYQQYGQPVSGQPMYQQAPAEPGALAGLQANLASVLCYLFGWISGLVFFFGDKRRDVRFHAMQSILLTGGASIVYILINAMFGFSWRLWWLRSLLTTVVGLGVLAIVIYLMVSAYSGKKVKLPVIGDIAERMSSK